MTTENEVREYVVASIIKPARQRGNKSISFTAADIHNGMELEQSFPLVCSAIDADKFQKYASVVLARRDGPEQSSAVRWVFDFNK